MKCSRSVLPIPPLRELDFYKTLVFFSQKLKEIKMSKIKYVHVLHNLYVYLKMTSEMINGGNDWDLNAFGYKKKC